MPAFIRWARPRRSMSAPLPCFPSATSAAPSQSERDDEEIVSPRDPFPDVGQNETRRADHVRASGRPACQAAKASTQTAAEVRATRVSTADQPNTGGRCKWKKISTRPKKRSLLARLPNSSAVQAGGTPPRCQFTAHTGLLRTLRERA